MTHSTPDHNRPALGIQQPWAELILRGIKTIEIRSQDTNVRGRIYLYASKRVSTIPPALTAVRRHALNIDVLPKGLLVGSVEIVDCAPCNPTDSRGANVPRSYLTGQYGWHLQNPEAFEKPLAVKFLPYGMWFYPFHRKGGHRRRRARST